MKTRTQYRIVSTITKEALQTEISGTFVDAHFCSVCSFLQKHRQNLQKRGYVCGNAQQKKIGWNAIKSNNHFTLSWACENSSASFAFSGPNVNKYELFSTKHTDLYNIQLVARLFYIWCTVRIFLALSIGFLSKFSRFMRIKPYHSEMNIYCLLVVFNKSLLNLG